MSTKTSTFSSTTTFIDSNDGGSRLMVLIQDASCTGGVTAGDVIHYDAIEEIYTKSIANNPVNAEVFGVVESVNIDASKNVVLYGSINLPTSAIEDIPAGSDGAGGGSDIYFLSPDNEGKLRNTTPTQSTQIAKAVYQVAPHGNYTGIVMNYIGYKVPSDITSYTESVNPIGSIFYRLPSPSGVGVQGTATNYARIDSTTTLTNGDYSEFAQKYGTIFGRVLKYRFTPNTEPIPNTPYGTLPILNTNQDSDNCYINSLLSDTVIMTGLVDFRNQIISVAAPYSIDEDPPISIGTQFGIERVSGNAQLGAGTITEIFQDTTRVPLPIFQNHRIFSMTDQDDNDMTTSDGNPNFFYFLAPYLKVKSQNTINTIRSLEANTVETQNITLDNDDLITTLTDLQNRIETAEGKVRK